MPHSLYGKIYTERYDIGDERHDILAYYLGKWQQLGRPSPVLEPMCGTGFFLIPFMEAGADIDGLDSSPYMLAECQKKCTAKNLRPSLYEQFLESIALPRQYGFVFIPDRSIAHIYQKSTAQAWLRKLWDHLLPGGWLILDVKTLPRKGEFGEPGQTDIEVHDRPDGSTVFSTSIWLERDNGRVLRNVTKYEKFMDGKLIEAELFDYRARHKYLILVCLSKGTLQYGNISSLCRGQYNERFYDQPEFAEMLQVAGFVDIRATKAYDDTEPAEHDVIVFSCRKQGRRI